MASGEDAKASLGYGRWEASERTTAAVRETGTGAGAGNRERSGQKKDARASRVKKETEAEKVGRCVTWKGEGEMWKCQGQHREDTSLQAQVAPSFQTHLTPCCRVCLGLCTETVEHRRPVETWEGSEAIRQHMLWGPRTRLSTMQTPREGTTWLVQSAGLQ